VTTAAASGVGATIKVVRDAVTQCVSDVAPERSKGVRTLRLLLPQLARLAAWGGTGTHDPAAIRQLVTACEGLADFVSLTKARDWKARAESEAFAAVVERARTALRSFV
jgi:hypothetical protein